MWNRFLDDLKNFSIINYFLFNTFLLYCTWSYPDENKNWNVNRMLGESDTSVNELLGSENWDN